ncbi:uncharacterized protein LOC134258147 [Saccostrea cucullata]|uniref:uncharacterized protein LOC134258147 n=1 Tax=Saccostrea cuccullata TaxID=36930 RepID=UPI002ED4EDC8
MSDFPKILMLFLFHASMDKSNGTTCPGSVINNGTSCPKNLTEWDIASKGLKCEAIPVAPTCPSESKLVYHCLLNQWSNGTVEVCAPPWFISGYCAMYSLDEKRIKNNFSLDCTNFSKPCPARYISTDAYKYQRCYDIVLTKTRKGNESKDDLLLILMVVSIFFLLVAGTVITVLCFKRKKNRKGQEMNNCEEYEKMKAKVDDVCAAETKQKKDDEIKNFIELHNKQSNPLL